MAVASLLAWVGLSGCATAPPGPELGSVPSRLDTREGLITQRGLLTVRGLMSAQGRQIGRAHV